MYRHLLDNSENFYLQFICAIYWTIAKQFTVEILFGFVGIIDY